MVRPSPLFILANLLSSQLLGGSFASALDCSGSGIDHSYYNYQDDVLASSSSPLPSSETPQFVALTFDDNGYSGLNGVFGGMDWLVNLLATRVHPSDGSPVLASFYFTTVYIAQSMVDNPVYVKRSWRSAMQAGHEVALHSYDHLSGKYYSQDQWSSQIYKCIDWLTKPWDPIEQVSSPNTKKGIGADLVDLVGWRSPFLEYNGALFDALKASNVWFDTSIEDGWQSSHDGTNYHWPYTLNNGSPGHDVLVGWGSKSAIGKYPGLWEFPVHPFIVPPDNLAARYGISKGLRTRCKNKAGWFDTNSGKITGFDYNLLVLFGMTAPEFLATLKHSFDLRYENNRAPFFPGFHSDYYSDAYNPSGVQTTPAQRRAALASFIDYVLTKPDVRMTTTREVLRWMRDPIPKGCLIDAGGGPGPSTTTTTTKMIMTTTTTTKMMTTTTKATTSTSSSSASCPSGVINNSDKDCTSSPDCCASGLTCYEKNQWWASCMVSCEPGYIDGYDNYPWSCDVLSSSGGGGNSGRCPSGSTITDESRNCASMPYCCVSGLTCYEKNRWWASCKATCVPGETDDYDNLPWSCVVLST